MKRAVLLMLMLPSAIVAAPGPRPISATRSYHGRIEADWRIEPDGSILYTRRGESRVRGGGILLTTRIPATANRYRIIAKLLGPAHSWAGKRIPCPQATPDMTSGIIHWGASIRLTFDEGCSGTPTITILNNLIRVQNQIEIWAAGLPAMPIKEEQHTDDDSPN